MARTPVTIVKQKTKNSSVFVARFFDEKGILIRTKTFSNAKTQTITRPR